MSDDGTGLLEDWRKKKFDSLKQNVTQGSYAQAESDLKNISLLDETISKAQPAKDPAKPRRRWAVIFGLAAVILLTAASSIRIFETDFKGAVLVKSFSIVLSEPWVSDDQYGGTNVSISNLATLKSTGLGLNDTPTGHYSLNMSHPKVPIFVSSLGFGAGAKVTLESDSGRLEMYVKNDSLSLSIVVPAGAALRIGGDANTSLTNKSVEAEFMEVTSLRVKEDPVRLVFKGIDEWAFDKLQATDLAFDYVVESDDNIVMKESSVLSGSLTIAQTGKKLDFESGDVIRFESLKTRRLVITPHGDAMLVSFEGSASKVLGGVSGFEDNLNPTWAGYLYSNSLVAFVYTSLGFLYLLL